MNVEIWEGVVDCVCEAGRDLFRDMKKLLLRGPKNRQVFLCVGVEGDRYCSRTCTIFLNKNNDRTDER